MASPKSMNLPELKAYKKKLQDQGKTLSTSKELGKVEDLIKTKQPENYGDETVSSAFSKLSSGVTEFGGWTESNLDNIEQYTGTRPQLGQPSPQQAAGIGMEGGMGASGFEMPGLDLSGLTGTQQSAIQAQLSQPSYTDLWEEYRSELGLGEKESLVSDLNKNIFDLEDDIEAIESDFEDTRSKDFLLTEDQMRRRISAEQTPLRDQYGDLLKRRERLTSEISSAQDLLSQQLSLAQSDMDRMTGIYKDVAAYDAANQEAAAGFDEASFWSNLFAGDTYGGFADEDIDAFLFGEEPAQPDTYEQIEWDEETGTFKPKGQNIYGGVSYGG